MVMGEAEILTARYNLQIQTHGEFTFVCLCQKLSTSRLPSISVGVPRSEGRIDEMWIRNSAHNRLDQIMSKEESFR